MLTVRLVLCLAIQVYLYILFARVILSFIPLFKPDWTPPNFLRPVVDLVYGLTEPPLQLLRSVIPQPMGLPLDLSFIVLYILIRYVLLRIVC